MLNNGDGCAVLERPGLDLGANDGSRSGGVRRGQRDGGGGEHLLAEGRDVTAIDLLRRNPDPTDDQIREQLDGNLCRCTGYHNIVRAVKKAATLMPGA